jgi:potassium-dependent mechanosensitive channel
LPQATSCEHHPVIWRKRQIRLIVYAFGRYLDHTKSYFAVRQAMLDHLQNTVRNLFILMLLSVAGAVQAEPADNQPGSSTARGTLPLANPTNAQAPAPPGVPHVNNADLTRRANEEMGLDIEATTSGWQRELDQLENNLRGPRLRYTELNGIRDELQRVRSSLETFETRLRPSFEAAKAQVDLLGPPPASGQPQEPEQAALNRAEITYYFGVLSAGEASVKAARLRIDQLINTIQDIRRKNFTTNLVQPVPGIYSYQTWAQLPEHLPMAASRIGELLTNWWKGLRDQEEVERISLEALLLCCALMLVGWRAIRQLRLWPQGEPPFWRRASTAAGVILLRVLPAVSPIVLWYGLMTDAEALPEHIDRLFYAAAQSIVIIFVVNALITTVFAPNAPLWRLIPASDRAATRICGLVLALAVVYGVTTWMYVVTRLVQAPFALTVAVALPSSLLLAVLVVAITLTPLEAKDPEGPPSLGWLKTLRAPIWAASVAIVVCAFAGYLALSRFLAQQLVVTGSILALVYLLLLWVDGFAQGLSDNSAAIGRWLKRKVGLEQHRREQLALPISLLMKFAVLVLSVPFIMLQWGYNWPDIYDWYTQLLFGFHIANTQVSLAALLASSIVFAMGYAAARLFQGWLDAQVLKPAGISGGIRDSIRTGVGYIGITIAALVAFSYAGFNLSNLAIVAGAFSIGIGFGLQSVVNNFVSGLILLAERPIKVGDLVIVGGEEGYVRKISVRSTEVETFDRAHVLVPNSYFITEKVKNWTLRNNICRISVAVGVTYNSDARKVKAILLNIAQEHPNVMTTPEPFVDLEEFGADSLNFKLYAYIYDLTKGGSTRTDLRIAMLDAFRRAGINMPFRQTELTIRSVDWLREAVGNLSEAFNGNGSANGNASPKQSSVQAEG